MYYFELNNLRKNLFIYLFIYSFLFSNDRGWIHPETGWEVISGSHMCIFSFNDVYINNELADMQQTDAIGIFFNNQCIGWAYYQASITFIPAIGDDGSNNQYPIDGDELSFYIYDNSDDIILDLQSIDTFPGWFLNTMQNINESFACSYNIPIQNNAECYDICDVDNDSYNNIHNAKY